MSKAWALVVLKVNVLDENNIDVREGYFDIKYTKDNYLVRICMN